MNSLYQLHVHIKELCDKSLVISYCYQHVLYTFLVTPEHPGIEGKFHAGVLLSDFI